MGFPSNKITCPIWGNHLIGFREVLNNYIGMAWTMRNYMGLVKMYDNVCGLNKLIFFTSLYWFMLNLNYSRLLLGLYLMSDRSNEGIEIHSYQQYYNGTNTFSHTANFVKLKNPEHPEQCRQNLAPFYFCCW